MTIINMFESATAIGLLGAMLYFALLIYVLTTQVFTFINKKEDI